MAVSINGSGPITGLTSIASPTTLNGLTIPTTGFGKVLQVVRATSATDFSTNSTSFTDVTGMSVTITPLFGTSILFIFATVNAFAQASTGYEFRGIVQLTDNSNNAINSASDYRFGDLYGFDYLGTQVVRHPITLIGRTSASTTSARTYKMRMRSENTDCTVGVRSAATTSQIFVLEVSA